MALILSCAGHGAGVALAGTGTVTGTGGKPQSSGKEVRIVNPYAQVDWAKVEFLHSFSHQHGRDPQVFWDMGFRHLPFSNYYPSRPVYPLPEVFVKAHPDTIGAPNAEQHSTIDSGIHFNAMGSYYTTGYGKTPRINADVAPIEHVFSDLNVFDAQKSPWLGIYRLDLSIAHKSGTDKEVAVKLTIQGASQVNHKTFTPVGDGAVRERLLTAKSLETLYLKTESNSVRVRLDFDPASTCITRFRLMQEVNRPWQDAFRAALDGVRKDSDGRPIEGLLFPDGGGITINHPRNSVESLAEMLDFDPRVLGIEVWNMYYAVHDHAGFGGTKDGPGMEFYRRWDGILRTGRRCFGFFVKDHTSDGQGRNVLLVPPSAGLARDKRERNALRAYREGCFFGLLGAMAVDKAGSVVAPYDYSQFRFARIAVRETDGGEPVGVEVAVTGADRTQRPNTQIRFITDAGVAHIANGDQAYFAFPRSATGSVLCRYVRVEAFAYPNTNLGGRPLPAAALSKMNVHEISCLHELSPSAVGPADQAPIPVVDMIFSQPILVLTKNRFPPSTASVN